MFNQHSEDIEFVRTDLVEVRKEHSEDIASVRSDLAETITSLRTDIVSLKSKGHIHVFLKFFDHGFIYM